MRGDWSDFVREAGRLAAILPPGAWLETAACPPPGQPDCAPEWLPPAAAEALARALPPLRRLDAAAPLVRDAAGLVWETLVLEAGGHPGRAYVTVANALGARERVTTLFAAGGAITLANWCASRSGVEPGDTSWDAARARRTVRRAPIEDRNVLIDPGAVRLVEIAEAAGAETLASCEGHPGGAYLMYHGASDEPLTRALAGLGPDWSVEGYGGSMIYARMRRVASVSDRNAVWRRTCAALERALGLEVGADAAPDANPRPNPPGASP